MNMKKVRWTFDGEAENKRVGCRTHGFRPILNSQFFSNISPNLSNF